MFCHCLGAAGASGSGVNVGVKRGSRHTLGSGAPNADIEIEWEALYVMYAPRTTDWRAFGPRSMGFFLPVKAFRWSFPLEGGCRFRGVLG